MTLHVKLAAFKVKAAGEKDGLADGEFEGYASVFGNVDSYGDIVEPGAFTRTLDEWSAKGGVIPVLWGHDLYDPFNNIGGLKSATQDEKGLLVKGLLDLENPTAAQVYRLMKGGRTNKMSFAYAVREAEEAEDGFHLKDLDLFEVSVVQIPANQEAEILAVKSMERSLLFKAGRVLSAKNEESLRSARDAIDSVLKALDSNDGEDGKGAEASSTKTQQTSEQTPVKADPAAEEPETAKVAASAEEPKSASSVDVWGAEFDIYSTAYAGKD